MRYRIPAGIGVLVLFSHLSAAQPDAATRSLARDVFQQLIEINTTDSVGSTTVAAQAMAKRLLDAGFPAADVKVLGPNDRKGNMVVRLHGTGAAKPILIIGHLDVVEARREDWTTDPFQFVEKDGYFYGRGTQDMKVNDAILVVTLIRFQREGYRPNRDIILALTADEEGGSFNGVDWLLKNHRDLIDAGFVLNADAGGILTEKGKPIDVEVEATEKLYADFQLTAKNPGGHSSLPIPDNAIYHIADALGRLERSPFPFELNPVTRAYFEQTNRRCYAGHPADAAGYGSARASFARSALQRDGAHHLRRHAAQRRSRQQRAAADRAGRGQLPDPAGAFGGRDPAATGSHVCGFQGSGSFSRSGHWRAG